MTDQNRGEKQSALDGFSETDIEKTTETVARTVICPLASSRRKNSRVREVVNEWQEMLAWSSDILPSYPPHERSQNNTHLYRAIRREFDDMSIRAADAAQAIYKVVEAYGSRDSRGDGGDRPRYDGTGSYIRIRGDGFELDKSDEAYGLKVKLQPYKPEWFRIEPAAYHRAYLDRVLNEDETASLGASELHLCDPDQSDPRSTLNQRSGEANNAAESALFAHLVVSEEVEVYSVDDVPRYVGVDIGETAIYATAVVGRESGEIEDVELESGREFRHYREQLKRKRERRSQVNDLRGVRECQGDIERYTAQILDTASRRVVAIASENAPCAIRIENLTHYRETAHDPIHDWPFAAFQERVIYKATAAGIPIEVVDPRDTSVTCRKCKQTDPAARIDRATFHCRRCGYEVHADVNAALNIANDLNGESEEHPDLSS